MGVDGGVTSSTSEVLVLPVGDVKMGLGVTVFLGKTKVNDVDLIAALADAHEEVVGLDVAVDEVAGVDVLDTGDLRGARRRNDQTFEIKTINTQYSLIGPQIAKSRLTN